MGDYYSDKLSAQKLSRCYEIAPPRVQRYLQAELEYTLSLIHPGSIVLELGCGYGRVLELLAEVAQTVWGIDTSLLSLDLARSRFAGRSNCHLARMNAAMMGFADGLFDFVICIQNGISAFHVDQRQLIEESLRVVKSGGMAVFSTYSDRFWDDRLVWFEMQAEAGLLGEIDYDKTGDGRIVCKDGFTATTVSSEQFSELCSGLDAELELIEVDDSSLFCLLRKR
jgi:2-polyprenyl-6-hydroxyphenyl methylase/3-demethylubiquinone-9 3-methyltransferase